MRAFRNQCIFLYNVAHGTPTHLYAQKYSPLTQRYAQNTHTSMCVRPIQVQMNFQRYAQLGSRDVFIEIVGAGRHKQAPSVDGAKTPNIVSSVRQSCRFRHYFSFVLYTDWIDCGTPQEWIILFRRLLHNASAKNLPKVTPHHVQEKRALSTWTPVHTDT